MQCRIEDDSSLTLVSRHGDSLTGIAAAGYAVEVEDRDFAYALYAGDPTEGSSWRVASFCEGRIGYRMWATKTGRISPSEEDRLEHDVDEMMALSSWPPQKRAPTRSVPTCDAWRGAYMTLSLMRVWPASGARERLGLWLTSTPSRSAVHGSAAGDLLRAGAPVIGLRFFCAAGWVAEIRGRLARCAHPLEKSAPGFEGTSIHRLVLGRGTLEG